LEVEAGALWAAAEAATAHVGEWLTVEALREGEFGSRAGEGRRWMDWEEELKRWRGGSGSGRGAGEGAAGLWRLLNC
jgi:hypothetical protein